MADESVPVQVEVTMTTAGAPLLKFLDEVRRFATQLLDLAAAAERQVLDEGWTVHMSQNVWIPNPKQLLPDSWFPDKVVRFYKHPRKANVICFVSVLLSGREQETNLDFPLEEPLLSAGLLTFPDAAKQVSADRFWWGTLHAYVPNRRDDGTRFTVCPKVDWADEFTLNAAWYPFESITTLAVPLIEISSPEQLSERFLQPLASLLKLSDRPDTEQAAAMAR
jgi:hypothetical protein